MRSVRVLRILSKFYLLPDMIVDGSGHIDSYTYNIFLNLRFVVVDAVDLLCFVIHVDTVGRKNHPDLADGFDCIVDFVCHVYLRNELALIL